VHVCADVQDAGTCAHDAANSTGMYSMQEVRAACSCKGAHMGAKLRDPADIYAYKCVSARACTFAWATASTKQSSIRVTLHTCRCAAALQIHVRVFSACWFAGSPLNGCEALKQTLACETSGHMEVTTKLSSLLPNARVSQPKETSPSNMLRSDSDRSECWMTFDFFCFL
jgi:hypothetical protein